MTERSLSGMTLEAARVPSSRCPWSSIDDRAGADRG
jgi:hypothetical protein